MLIKYKDSKERKKKLQKLYYLRDKLTHYIIISQDVQR